METYLQKVTEHYHQPGLYEIILQAMQKQGIDPGRVGRNDIAAVDEFHVRGAEVSREMAAAINLRNERVLDIGCGIGGPARMLADDFNCTVTGLDLNPEFIRTARLLTELTGLTEKIQFVRGNALELPFPADSFDVVWTQHVQMNIQDKRGFYREIYRVLRPGGHFLFYDIFRKGTTPVQYPMPWADDEAISFLFSFEDLNETLDGLGFKRLSQTDQTGPGIAFFDRLFEKVRKEGSPGLGVNILMGKSGPSKLANLLTALKQGKLSLQSGIAQK